MPSAGPLRAAQLAARFAELDQFLLAHQALWQPRPFYQLKLDWEDQHPELAQWLRNRSLEQAEAAHNHPEQLRAPEPFLSLAQRSAQLSELGYLPSLPTEPRPHRLSVDIPGRKLAQIQAFASCLSFQSEPQHWLDWCSGKGHLGRWLTASGQTLTCLEWDAALCDSGATLSQRQQINASHIQQDVLADDVSQQLNNRQSAVALHACGDLHVQLLKQASRHQLPHVALAPCCYNRTEQPIYQALSKLAQQSALVLSRDDLSLPLSETVTAPQRTRRQRDQSMAWRLGFDLLQRHIRQTNAYLHTPSLNSQALLGDFRSFCQTLAERKGLMLGEQHGWADYEAAGWQRLAQVRNLELLRNLFRRPLELWLVLDRALYLQEHGYRVELGYFCDYQLSPRNLLLKAELEAVDNFVEKT